jgi:hypothetical protein
MDAFGGGYSPFAWLGQLFKLLLILYPLVVIGSGILAYWLCRTRDGGERFLIGLWVSLFFLLAPVGLVFAPVLFALCPLLLPAFVWLRTKPRGSL